MAKTGSEMLAELREELKAQGKTTRQLGRERIYFALDWIYRWGWSSPSMIDMTTGAMRRGLCAKLVKAGLLIETKTAAGKILEDIPSKIVTLSEDGLAYVEKHKDEKELMDYPLNPYRVNQALLRHDLLAQRATIRNLQAGKIEPFAPPENSLQNRRQASNNPMFCGSMKPVDASRSRSNSARNLVGNWTILYGLSCYRCHRLETERRCLIDA